MQQGVVQKNQRDGCVLCNSDAATLLFRGTDRLFRFAKKRFNVVRCSKCGLLRLSPVPSPDELRSYYPESYWYSRDDTIASKLEQLYRRLVLRDHLNFLRGMSGPALDVGCGGGLLLT